MNYRDGIFRGTTLCCCDFAHSHSLLSTNSCSDNVERTSAPTGFSVKLVGDVGEEHLPSRTI